MSVVREKLARGDDARSLLRDLFRTEADLCPDANAAVLTIHLHSMTNPRSNRAIHHLLTQLNAAELTYPRNQLQARLHPRPRSRSLKLGPPHFPRGQEI